jgi:uncharacterized membrane protein
MVNIHVIETFHLIIEWAALVIELLAVTVIVSAVVIVGMQRGTVRYLFQLGDKGGTENYKHQLGKSLLVGLELLVAADVIRTVALEPTVNNVAVLGLLVAVRTILSWSLSAEIDRRWSWQARTWSNINRPINEEESALGAVITSRTKEKEK